MVKKRNSAYYSPPNGRLRIGKNPYLPDTIITRIGIVESVLQDRHQWQLSASTRGSGLIRQSFKKSDQLRPGHKRQLFDA